MAVAVAIFAAGMITACFALPSNAGAFGAVAGVVSDAGGAPIAGAAITLAGSRSKRTARAGSTGGFSIANVAAGTYVLNVRAAGYEDVGARTVEVAEGQTTWAAVQMVRSTSSLTTLGHVVTRAGEALSTSAAPAQSLDAQAFAAGGNSSLPDMLSEEATSATVVRPAGGGVAAPAAVALRGPDPTETLLEIDGHELNSGGSGAFDVSLLDPAQLSDVQLIYGIAPSSLAGPNTIDGAINMRTLDPTVESHGLYRLSLGSFSTYGETLQATGTSADVGYALSLHRQTTGGETAQSILTADGSVRSVGSAVAGDTGIAKVRAALGRAGGSVLVTVRDQSAYRGLSAALSAMLVPSQTPGGIPTYDDFSGSSQLAHGSGLGVDVQLPFGRGASDNAPQDSLVVRHLTSVDDSSVFGPAAGIDPYLLNARDVTEDEIVQIDRALPAGSLSAKIDVRSESLATQVTASGIAEQSNARLILGATRTPEGAAPEPPAFVGLAQTQRWAAIRYTLDSAAKLHYSFAAYYSSFSSFSTSVDPRFGAVWTPTARTSVRASFGTTFQSPQLTELCVPPVLPPPDANGFFNIGNPNLKADRATDLGLGVEHLLGGAAPARASIDFYRTNLRGSAQRFIPALDCAPPIGPPPPPQSCESFPINVGSAVYQGLEARFEWHVGSSTRARATYAVNSAYPAAVSALFQDGTIVPGEQFSGVPLQSGSFSIERADAGAFTYSASLHYEGRYNELNRPPFATLQAGATWHRGRLDVGVFGTNLTDVFDDRFTLARQRRALRRRGRPDRDGCIFAARPGVDARAHESLLSRARANR